MRLDLKAKAAEANQELERAERALEEARQTLDQIFQQIARQVEFARDWRTRP
ncbi:hypothetical protein ABZ647_17760 [Micromonospora aurantiaca]|uniref:hypothetical protein n=1 Tax=Micromonospora aurantiaca (nom. illeg.) TaxID=47850 RepID=UPI003411349D